MKKCYNFHFYNFEKQSLLHRCVYVIYSHVGKNGALIDWSAYHHDPLRKITSDIVIYMRQNTVSLSELDVTGTIDILRFH